MSRGNINSWCTRNWSGLITTRMCGCAPSLNDKSPNKLSAFLLLVQNHISQRLYRQGVDEQLIRERTRHRSDAIHAYKQTSSDQQHRISEFLDYQEQRPSTSRANLHVHEVSHFNVSEYHDVSFGLTVDII